MAAKWSVCRLVAGALVVALSGCGGGPLIPPPLRVGLSCALLPGGNQARVTAQVSGPADGLEYSWYPKEACSPPLSRDGETVCYPGAGLGRLPVTVALVRDGGIVGNATTECVFGVSAEAAPVAQPPAAPDQGAVPAPSARATLPAIRIANQPRLDPSGGPDTRTEVWGTVSGASETSGYFVVIYCKTDRWYVQPLVGSRVAVGRDGRWSTWSHTGSQYAALLVRGDFDPPAAAESLPSSGVIVSRDLVPRGARPE
jgi:hypothetical protein